jgi:hypothetical protein
MTTLTDSQVCAVYSALRVAADQYEYDAQAVESAQPSLAVQFRRQRDAARALADRFEDSESVNIG